MAEVAKITIEIRFSKVLEKNLEKARAQGEHHTVQSIVDRLVHDYRQTVANADQFRRPLKALDKGVKVEVKGEVY